MRVCARHKASTLKRKKDKIDRVNTSLSCAIDIYDDMISTEPSLIPYARTRRVGDKQGFRRMDMYFIDQAPP